MNYIDGTSKFLNYREDADGCGSVYAKMTGGAAVKNTGYLIGMGTSGWQAVATSDLTITIARSFLVGFAETAITTNSWGWFQVKGPISGAIISTSTATVGHGVEWAVGKFDTSGAACLNRVCDFGVFTATGASGTTHDLMLFGKFVSNNT